MACDHDNAAACKRCAQQQCLKALPIGAQISRKDGVAGPPEKAHGHIVEHMGKYAIVLWGQLRYIEDPCAIVEQYNIT